MMETTERKVFGGGIVRMIILATLAALMAITAVASVGAKDAQAAMGNDAQRNAIVSHAYKMLNNKVPYVWSTNASPCSMNGADCECLNRLSYAKANIKLPYSLGGQIDAGRWTGSPMRGDLIFLDTNGDGDYRDMKDHTGVYVGNGQFIHQSTYFKGTDKMSLSDGRRYIGPYKFVSVVPYR